MLGAARTQRPGGGPTPAGGVCQLRSPSVPEETGT